MKTLYTLLLALLCTVGAQAFFKISPTSILKKYGDGEANGQQIVATISEYSQTGEKITYEVQNVMEWSTSDSAVATVDSTGYVTFVAPGYATIKGVYKNESTGSCSITVLPPHPGGDDAVSMLREDLIWVYANYNMGSGNVVRYILRAKGDTLIDGRQYKQFHRRIVYGVDPLHTSNASSIPKPLLREERGMVYNYLPGNYDRVSSYPFTANVSDTGARDHLIYDYNEPEVYWQSGFNRDFSRLPDVVIEGVPRKVYRSADRVIVEGLGMEALSNERNSDVMAPAREPASKSGWCNFFQYVANSKGEILIYSPMLDEYPVGGSWDDVYWDEDIIDFAYHPYNFNTDGVFDIEDLNLAINRLMTNPTDPTTDKYYHETYPYSHTMDVNFDGTVDIEDINMLINQLLHESDTYKLTDLVNVATE